MYIHVEGTGITLRINPQIDHITKKSFLCNKNCHFFAFSHRSPYDLSLKKIL